MIKRVNVVYIACLLSIVLVGCDPNRPMNNPDMGTVTGGVLGGIVGAQFDGNAATIMGTLLGGYLGRNLATNRSDKNQFIKYLNQTPLHESRQWRMRDGSLVTIIHRGDYSSQGRSCCRIHVIIRNKGRIRRIRNVRLCKVHASSRWLVVSTGS